MPAARRRAFTLLELLIAVALSIVLIRGMYTMFHAATSLTRMSEEKMIGLFEVSAAFDYLSADFARCASDVEFRDEGDLCFKVLGRSDDKPFVYVVYSYSGSEIKRSVCEKTDGGGLDPCDDDGDGDDDVNLVVARNVTDFEVSYHNPDSGSLEGGNWRTAARNDTRAVRVRLTLDKMTPNGQLGAQEYMLVFPVMSN
ncbi:MAG: prepilin-type N-terminal cleavage/methylation domain-containing protein [Planctomycetota bacterium]